MKKYFTFLLPLHLFCIEEAVLGQKVALASSTQTHETETIEHETSYVMDKSGFLLGADVVFGKFKIGTAYNDSIFSFSSKDTCFSTMFGIFVGYQHYFDENFGLRTTLHAASGIIGDAQYSVGEGKIQNTATPLWLGLRLSVLWDFLHYGEHAVGVSAGVGYNAEIYLNHRYSYGPNVLNASSLIQHNLYPILGIHYYFRHHQFEVNYRFSGSLNHGAIPSDEGFETQIKYYNYIGISYAYRF